MFVGLSPSKVAALSPKPALERRHPGGSVDALVESLGAWYISSYQLPILWSHFPIITILFEVCLKNSRVVESSRELAKVSTV